MLVTVRLLTVITYLVKININCMQPWMITKSKKKY